MLWSMRIAGSRVLTVQMEQHQEITNMLANSELGGVFDDVRTAVSLILTLRMSFPRSWTTSAQRTSMPSAYPSSSHARCTTSTTETLYIPYPCICCVDA
jgi:hypothetical protein